MNINLKHFILHCSLIEGVGPVAIQQLLEIPKTVSIEDLYRFNHIDFLKCGFSDGIAQKLVAGLRSQQLLDNELQAIEQYAAQWTVIGSLNYPELLASIYAPPPVLYWYGDSLEIYKDNLAIVGSRKANKYGETVVDAIIEVCVANNINIMSGGAFGIDGMAHRAALKKGGKTVVITGAGLAHPYPQSHEKMFKEIAKEGGSVLSIFPITLEALPGNFPARNRVISGLSQVCLVVQAAQKSGALITAYHALEQGREVLAIPGYINDPLHAGCHEIIRQGATLIAQAEDVLIAFGIDKPQKPNKSDLPKISQLQSSKIKLTEMQQTIFDVCKNASSSIDDIIQITNFSYGDIQLALFELQLSGLLSENAGGQWTV
jgi:DNA processing protein